MSVRIRLQRHGAKKRPFYRVVAADQRARRDGRFIELLGTYNPLTEPPTIRLKGDRVKYWLGVGAQPSETAAWLIKQLEDGKVIDLSVVDAEASAVAQAAEAKAAAIVAAREEAAKQAAAAAEAAAAPVEEPAAEAEETAEA